jgi:2-C-methyl-D-erythritol 2,4-cyclodiphosphate synthase
MKPGVRIGLGFDFHPFEKGRELFLGGIKIGHRKGLLGHSDADVVAHALIDALLGAVGLSDIGVHFPDHDPRYQGVSSLTLLADTFSLVQERGWGVGNIDIVVIAEEPSINPHRNAMRVALSSVLQISPEDINIKATTMEGKGPIGRREGIASQAIVLLVQNSEVVTNSSNG